MAMEQGEQRAIHPFFRKDFRVSTPSLAPLPNDHILDPSGSHPSNGSQPIPPVAALDHDPNIDRRKRRKTDIDAPKVLQNGQSATDDEAPHDGADNSNGHQLAIINTKAQDLFEAPGRVDLPAGTVEDRPEQPTAKTIHTTNSDPNDGAEKKRKVVKLNANGKLLSSPVANEFVDKSKTRGNKRGKSAAHNSEDRGQKIVIIKYSGHQGSSEDLGKQIDDVLAGSKRYTPHAVPNVVPPAAPKVVLNHPAKATHPFFLKKAASKPDNPVSQNHDSDSTSRSSVDNEAMDRSTHPRPSSKLFSSFNHAFPKIPDAIQPLWPPLGLSHVRGSLKTLELNHDRRYLRLHRRKSKTPAIRISDEESVISSAADTPNDSAGVLRVPERQVASGRALQMIIAKRLAKAPTEYIAGGPLKDPCHPAIMQLYSSLTTSTTAFDRGGYEAQLWANKYAPGSAPQVLCATKEALMLRDWLNRLIVSSVETGSSSKDNEKTKRQEDKKRKKRKKADKLDGFIVGSDEEASEMGEISGSDDELAGDVTTSTKRTVIRTGDLTINVRSGTERSRLVNTILISGPSGCGKTASVYAVAKEMGFEVFEINPGTRRSAKDILDRLGDMTRNHLVHNVNTTVNPTGIQPSTADIQQSEDTNQNKLMGFFKSTTAGPANKPGTGKAKACVKEADMKQARSQKQSLILLEEVDILFEEDKQFWTGVLTLINQSKRPIIMTCNDESLIRFDDISFHAILRYRAPPQDLAVDYLLLMAASEGHILKRAPVEKLYQSTDSDLRKSITELNYWCQIAVGSEKSGLDWLLDRWPQGADLDENGDKLRVLSTDTYRDYMGWLSRDMLISDGPSTMAELQEEALQWWDLSLQDADSTEDIAYKSWTNQNTEVSKLELLDDLRHQSEHMELRSVLDVLATPCSFDARKDVIDTSIPPLSEKQKLNYVEGYQLLSADCVPEYTALTAEIGSNFGVLLETFSGKPRGIDSESVLAAKVLATSIGPKTVQASGIEFSEALVPIMRPGCAPPPSNTRAEMSTEHSLQRFAEDLAPYVRAIVAFDLRLEQYRLELSRLLSGDGRGAKRIRTTRASRAALEGGSKSETRKERWFSPAINVPRILGTGKREWQDLLVQNGYFSVPVAGEQLTRENSEPISESASDIA